MAASETYARWRYRLIPDHVVGEVLTKPWIDNAIPFMILILVVYFFGTRIPGFLTVYGLSDLGRVLGEYLFIAIGMTFVMMAGGIDLSVGSNFALCNLAALMFIGGFDLALGLAMPAAMAVGAVVGLINGVLVGYLKLRAFLTTLVTLVIVRAVVDMLAHSSLSTSGGGIEDSAVWEFMADGSVLGIPSSLVAGLIVAAAAHVFLTRTGPGWHILAVGGSRRSAHNNGIRVPPTVCFTYVLSGAFTSVGAMFYAARLSNAGAEVGLGMEITVLTAVVLGGISLGGGRGSVAKAVLGMIIVVMVQNALIRLGLRGGASSLALGLIMFFAVAIDVRWMKNRHKVLTRAYVSPTYFALQKAPSTSPGSGSPYALNEKLRGIEAVALGQLDGPEDMILDRDDNIYCGSRHGDVIRIFGPDHKRVEVFAHIGGSPLGMAFDGEGNLVICVGGMGIYKVTPNREVVKLADETNRTPWSVIDDSRLRLADDLDIAPDGRVFFSEATTRYEAYDWPVDAIEARGNGRIICYDPRTGHSRTIIRNLIFPNGVCVALDGESFFFAQTWACRISRYWFAGPRSGKMETVLDNLPGYPDNINRASDGNYWCALVGMRSAVFDLAMRMPGFRRRMVYRVAKDEWLFPNLNTGCVIKFDEAGRILDVLWDEIGSLAHPHITSIREHKGYLYLGGIYANRIGKYTIPGADPNWTGMNSYWGAKS